MSRTIQTGAGEIASAYVTIGPFPGVDMSSESSTDFAICLGTYTSPTTFGTPTTVTHNTDGSVTLSLLIGNGHVSPTAGTYWTWGRRTASPTTSLTRSTELLRIVTDSGTSLTTLQPWVAASTGITGLALDIDGVPYYTA